MNPFINLLKKIYEMPGLYIWKKSLPFLVHFIGGYSWGEDVINGHSKDASNAVGSRVLEGFDEFVYTYYDCKITALNGEALILKNSTSDEDAFDKYFELLDMFLKEKGLPFL